MFGRTIIALFTIVLAGTMGAFAEPAPSVAARRIVAVFDGDAETAPRFTRIHRYAELPLNYLGYQLDYLDVAGDPLPLELDADVAAVLVWFDKPLAEPGVFLDWAAAVRRTGSDSDPVKFVAFGDLAVPLIGNRLANSDAYLTRLGLAASGYEHRFGIWSRVVESDPELIGFERDFSMRNGLLPVVSARAPNGVSHLRVSADPGGKINADLVVTAPDGGYVHGAALVREDGSGFGRWILDPFGFFELALEPGLRPIPDSTTLSGRRIFFSTVNGEGWTTPAPADRLDEAPLLAGAIVLEQFLAAYPDLPATLTLVTGDLDPVLGGAFAQEGAALARAALTLPQVKGASRSRTLPARWEFFETYQREDELEIVGRLGRPSRPVDRGLVSEAVSTLGRAFAPSTESAFLGTGGDAPRRYMLEPFDLESEIEGSLATVNGLAPAAGRTSLIAWSGNAQVFEAALRSAREAGVGAIGGGGGVIDSTLPTLSNLAPIAVPVGKERQVYAALSDDAAYTNFWTEPSHGFVRLAETVEATERPRRLKPYQLSFSAYSALNFGFRNAVRFHLDHARSAEVTPIAASEYAAIARGFSTTRITSQGERQWQIEDRGSLQTVRFDAAAENSLDMMRSVGVVGARRVGERLYVALDAAHDVAVVALAEPGPGAPAVLPEPGMFGLDNARWNISDMVQSNCALSFSTFGYGPGEMHWNVPKVGAYRVEVFEPLAADPIYWDDLRAGEDRILTMSLPPAAGPVRVALSGC